MSAADLPHHVGEADTAQAGIVQSEPFASVEAEQSVLGALLIDNAAFERVEAMLTPASFHRPEHRLIFEATLELLRNGQPADVITVFERLRHAGKDQAAGGLAYLNALAQSVPSASSLRHYAEIVREKARQRELVAACERADGIAREPLGDFVDKRDRVAAVLAPLERIGEQRATVEACDAVRQVIDHVRALEGGEIEDGWPIGIGPFDRIVGGVLPGQLVVYAARPGVGKSILAGITALTMARTGRKTLLCSLEMPARQVMTRLISHVGRVDNAKLRTGRLDSEDVGRMVRAGDEISRLPLLIDDQGGLNIHQLRAKARGVRGLKVLIVDYVQLMSSTLRGANRNAEIEEITKGLKSLALQLDIAVIALSQLNRNVEMRVDREPALSDLRDSGSIEQDADIVLMLWAADEIDAAQRVVGFKVSKNRDGEQTRFAMQMHGPTYTFMECAEPLGRRDRPTASSGWKP